MSELSDDIAAAAARGRERWLTALGEDAEAGAAILAHARWGAALERLFAFSPFLTGCAVREAAMLVDLLSQDRLEALSERIGTELGRLREAPGDTPEVMALLRTVRRRVALLVALADISDAWSLEQVTDALSNLADAAVALALAAAWHAQIRRGKLRRLDEEGQTPWRGEGCGITVLAMGKLGAHELNYSSDIDLIVFYDVTRLSASLVDQQADHGQIAVQVTRECVRLLEERTADGTVFRCDLRLRPDPSSTPIAVTLTAAESYYASVGQNWERAAMIKARPIAGDPEIGKAALSFLRPWVWRRSLDFAAVQDIHSIKRQIDSRRGGPARVAGYNVKLGPGGIREIEFFVQTQQLIFGGRDGSLRGGPTLFVLQALVEAGHVAGAVRDDLDRAYRFYRRVEHRLQMIEDRQTHCLPDSAAGLERFSRFLGLENAEALAARLTAHRARVSGHYAALFSHAPPLARDGNLVFTGADDDPDTLATLYRMGFENPSSVAAAIRGWHHGRYRATRSSRSREYLTELVPALLEAFARRPHQDQAFQRFDAFLRGLPAGVQLFALLTQRPALLDLVAEIMGAAPLMATALERNPSLLESVVLSAPGEALPDRDRLEADLAEQLALCDGYEQLLDGVRRWRREASFLAGIAILRGEADGITTGGYLSDIADLSLAALIRAAWAEFADRHGTVPGARFALLGLGKLGSRAMSFLSDLDLVAVYDVPDGVSESIGDKPLPASTWFIRFTQRLITAITAQTPEGRLYETDLRLRPTGNDGPLAVRRDGFEAYYAPGGGAWNWELMALTRARAVAGDPSLGAALEDTIRQILAQPRDGDQLLREVAEMRQRIAREHGVEDPWKVKHVAGGLVDIDFIAQYLQLRHGAEFPGVLSRDSGVALGRLAEHGLIERELADRLIEALAIYRRVQAWRRLTDNQSRPDQNRGSTGYRAGLARAVMPDADQIDFEAAETHIVAVQAACRAAFDALIAGPAAAPEQILI